MRKFSYAIFLMAVIGLGIFTTSAHAITGWKPGRIIDDSVFTNYNSLSLSSIQSFLNSKVPSCDTYGQKLSEFGGPDLNGDGRVQRWEYGKSRYNQTKFVCLRDYKASDGRTAAKIIYDTAQKYRISPKVLIVLLQKEQSLVTDTWPFNVQYRSATGYGCPDTAPCDSQYYWFTNQVDWAAKMFRAIMDNSPTWYTPYELGANYIQYNPIASCGGSVVNIENRATQALYNYTPYQPNSAALAAGWGSANCGAYGNRNFFLYFSNWFGQPNATATYGYSIVSQALYSDAGYANKVGTTAATVTPGSNLYAKVVVKNTGNQTWYKDFLRMGTANPHDRSSAFYDTSWLGKTRPTAMNEDSVAAGGTATFTFKMTAPSAFQQYTDDYGVLLEGQRWLSGNTTFSINVTSPTPVYQVEVGTPEIAKDSGMKVHSPQPVDEIYEGETAYVRVKIKNTGNRDLPTPSTRIGTGNPKDRISDFYNSSWVTPQRAAEAGQVIHPGDTGTMTFSITAPTISTAQQSYQETFGVLIDGQLWINSNAFSLGFLVKEKPKAGLTTSQEIAKGGLMLSSNYRYLLAFQTDGNLVLYDRYTNKALWSSHTNKTTASKLVLQPDGNVVLYSSAGKPLWSTRTYHTAPNKFVLQPDGNIVVYTSSNKPVWQSNTHQSN